MQTVLHAAAVLLLILLPSDAAARSYGDPGGVFTIQLPDGWNAERKRGEIGWETLLSSDRHIAKLLLVTGPIPSTEGKPADLKERLLIGLGKPFFSGWFEGLQENTRARIVEKVHRTKILGFEALQMRVVYYRGDSHDPREGRAVFLLSKRNALFLVLSGSRTGLAAGDRILTTLRIAPDR